MIDQLLDILKIAFLVLLYLFFLRVLWVVLTEVRATRSAQAGGPVPYPQEPLVAEPGPAPPPPVVAVPASRAKRSKRGTVGRLQVVEPRSRKGTSYGVQAEITLGRSVLTGVGMLANNATREFRLMSKVHGTYQPPVR